MGKLSEIFHMPPKSSVQKKATKEPAPKVARKPRTTKKNTKVNDHDDEYIDQNDETTYDHEIDPPTSNDNNNNNNNNANQLDAVINALTTTNPAPLPAPKSTPQVKYWTNAETGMLLLLCNGCPALGKSPQGILHSLFFQFILLTTFILFLIT